MTDSPATALEAPPLAAPAIPAAERERTYRRNFAVFLGDYVLFSIGMGLIGSTTVIPDFIRRLTDAEVLIALSSQLFEIGWLLPQLLVARQLVRVRNKKWWFVGPNIAVRPVLLIFAGVIVLLGPDRPGAILAAFLVFYGIAALGDGLVGVPWLDLAGSSLDARRRARLFGYGNASVGVAMLALASVVRLILGEDGPAFPNNYALLFALAGGLMLATIPVTLLIKELPGGEPRAAAPSLRDYLPELGHVLRTDRPFRAMIVARVLSSLYTLAAPFYIGYGTEVLGLASSVAVSNLLVMQTIGSVAGALLFSRWGERRTLRFIRLAMVVGLAQVALALSASALGPAALYVAFMAGGLVQGSLGISFMNWVVTYAAPDQRPIYSGLFNSVSAVSLLSAPLLGGLLVEGFDYRAAFAAALLAMASGLWVALRHVRPAREAAGQA